jgi:nucleoside-diphosphate-sugar epimerase
MDAPARTGTPPASSAGSHRLILGCGYVGLAAAKAWRRQGHRVSATTTRPERRAELVAHVDGARLFAAGGDHADLGGLDGIDGLLISVAPGGSRQQPPEEYRRTFVGTIQAVEKALRQRTPDRPLAIVLLSSCSVYGDRGGQLTDESVPVDRSQPHRAVLAEAEDRARALGSASVRVCILRLGGIHGPDRNVAERLRQAAGRSLPRDGDAIAGWIHRDDVVRGAGFALDHSLNGTFNLVDDQPLSGRQLSDRVCAAAGLPPVRWERQPTPGQQLHARVSNAKLKRRGFVLRHPSLLEGVLPDPLPVSA